MTIIDHIMLIYEMACKVHKPKSYQWEGVAKHMYEIAKEFKEREMQ